MAPRLHRRARAAPESRLRTSDARLPSVARIRVIFENGDPERVIEFDPARAPFQHDGKAGSILDVLLGHGIHLEHACGGNCACTTCHVIVKGGGDTLSASDESGDDLLDKAPGLTPTSRPQAADLEICRNLVPGGLGSPYLLGLPVGAEVRFTGPWGTFVLDRAPEAEVIFVADGTAIAPIRPMLRRAVATATRHPLRLLYGAAGPERLLYRAELEAMAREHTGFRFEHVPSARLRDEIARRWVDGDADRGRRFFICGVGVIVPLLRDLLRGAGYERRAVQYEKW